MKNKQTCRTIDLFCGAGGLTDGFRKTFGKDLEVVWSNDNNKSAVESYNANFGNHCVQGDLLEILEDPNTVIPQADLVIGGPPCQGFSLLNRNRIDDPRKQLWRPFLDVVSRSGASVFVMENVPQLLGSLEHEQIKAEAESMQFSLAAAILRAADYGVPQRRYRAFIIGCKSVDPRAVFPPRRTHTNPDTKARSRFSIESEPVDNLERWQTVKDAIGDLPFPEGTDIKDVDPPLNLHFGRSPTPESLKRYKVVNAEGMNRFDLQRLAPQLTPECWIRKKTGGTDLFGRLWWDQPAFTIRTEFYKPEKGRYLHPSQHRPLTHREAARLQSFDDNFKFCGTKIEIAKQIGNAVPALLAAAVARSVSDLIAQISERNFVAAK